MENIDQLELQLAKAKQRLDAALKTWNHQVPGGTMAYDNAHQAVISLERRIAETKGEEYAVPLDGFPVRWDIGAPMPHLLVNDRRALLAFYMNVPDPNWDGTYVTIKNPNDETTESLALVEFSPYCSARLGDPNDVVFDGHPLSGRGQESYAPQVVKNSRWIKEVERINSVHLWYNPENWKTANHYIFWFHDTTFEYIAESWKVETYQESMREMLARMADRILM